MSIVSRASLLAAGLAAALAGCGVSGPQEVETAGSLVLLDFYTDW